MRKLIITSALILSLAAFGSCDNRDENGVTDANNTDASKRETDSTRGQMTSDSLSTDTTRPH